MVHAVFLVQLHEEWGVTAPSRAHPSARFRILTGIAEDPVGYAIIEVEAEDVGPILDEMRALPELDGFEVLEQATGRAVVRYGTRVAELYRLVREVGILPAFPYEIRDGQIRLELTTAPDRLHALGQALRDKGIGFEVLSVSHDLASAAGLTDRQREVAEAAVREGYYDVPRRCTLTELAGRLGIAPSTASAILQRAESAVMRAFTQADLAGESSKR